MSRWRKLYQASRWSLYALVTLTLLAAIGCSTIGKDPYFMKTVTHANVYVAPVKTSIYKIAVMPFKAPTELVGASVSDMFVTEMLRAKRYELVERGQMAQFLSESELMLSGISESRATEIGSMVGADGVLIGTIGEYGEEAQKGRTYPVVGITARLIDVRTGKIMWSVDLASRSESSKRSLHEHASRIVHEMTAAVYQKWDVQKTIPRPTARTRTTAESTTTPVRRTATPPPEPPSFKLSDMSLREVRLSWTDIPANASKFRIERSAAMEGPFSVVATVSVFKKGYSDKGTRGLPLADLTTYYYRITALSSDGQKSVPSGVRESMTAPPPDPPTYVKASPCGSRGIKVSWEPSASEGVTAYVVERAKEDGVFTKLRRVATSPFTEGGTSTSALVDETLYQYRISSVNRVGSQGGPSKPATATTKPPPEAVTGFRAESGGVRSVPLTWDASEEENIVGYDIYRSGEDGTFQLLASVKGLTTTSYVHGGREPGLLADETTHQYYVCAVNNVGSVSEPSRTALATTRGAPPAVTDVDATSYHPREVPLHWTISTDEKVTGYEIRRATEDGEFFTKIGQVTGRETTEFLDKGHNKRATGLGALRDGTKYRYQVLAFNGAHVLSPKGFDDAATTKSAPDQPLDVAATDTEPREIEISWRTNPERDITAYVIESSHAADGRFRALARTEHTETQTTQTGLGDGKRRYYRVKAIDRDTLESGWSEVVEGATKPVPDPPTTLAVAWSDEGARITWTAPEQVDVNTYKIWKKKFLGEELLEKVETRECTLSHATVGKKLVVQISAVDDDGLQSMKSTPLEIRSPK